MARVIFHLDMDAFYASVEQRDKPELRGKPVIVGSPPNRRGVVCAASYEARKFGVRSAMPSTTAGRLCPQGVFIRPEFTRYSEESKKIMAIVAETNAIIEQVSIDEAYLDFSATIEGEGDAALYNAVPLAKKLKARIRDERELNTSIGIAANKLLAKLGSGFNKPDGLTLIPDRDKVLFLRPLPVRAIHGVGSVTEKRLIQNGIHTIADIQDYPTDLQHLLGSFGPALKRYAVGEDERAIGGREGAKSIGSENTFYEDTDDRKILRATLRELAEDIARRLQRKQLGAYTIQVKVRYSDFTTLTRQMTVEDPISHADDLYRFAANLLRREKLVSRPLRLLGLSTSSLGEPFRRQLELPFEKP
ncbi:MAG: DNA polymerase IV [Limisphaerales bacterium]